MAGETAQFTAEELSLLYRVARALLAERDYGELLGDLLGATIEALGADRGFVVVREGSGFRAAVARDLNIRIEQFPSNLIASLFNFQPRQFFESAAAERDSPQV